MYSTFSRWNCSYLLSKIMAVELSADNHGLASTYALFCRRCVLVLSSCGDATLEWTCSSCSSEGAKMQENWSPIRAELNPAEASGT